MTELLHFDQYLFHLINSGWQNPFFDVLMPLLRNKYTWVPFYLFLLVFLLVNFQKTGVYLILALVLTVGLTDMTSSHLIKKTVKRLRPCKVLEQPEDMRLLVPCGSGYSFPSSHAANHFAMAVFLSLALGRPYRWLWPVLICWAASIALAQIYVGVHFPVDAVAGALLGTLLAWAVQACTKRLIQWQADIH